MASRPCGLQSRDAFSPVALRAALASGGTACAIPRRAVLGAPCVAGQGLGPDRMAGFRSDSAQRADVGVLREISARGFAWREGWQRLVSGDHPAEIPAPGRCPAWPWPPGPDQSRTFARLGVRPPVTAGRADSGRCGRRGHGLRPSPLALGGRSVAGRARSAAPANPAVHRLRSGSMGSAWRAGVFMSVRPAEPVARAVVSGLRPGLISRGTASPSPAALCLAPPGVAGQGLHPDRLGRPCFVDRCYLFRVSGG